MFPSSVRAKAMSLGAFVNRLTSSLIAFSFLPLSKVLGGQAMYFTVFGAVTALSAVYIYALVPETKGLPLEATCHTLPCRDQKEKSSDIRNDDQSLAC